MADKGLYAKLKGTKKDVDKVDIQPSLFKLTDDILQKVTSLSPGQKQTIARLRAWVEINLKDFENL